MFVLGISAFYHDSAACLIKGDQLLAAAQEERFTRRKHDPRFPSNAIEYCLEEVGISPEEIGYVAFYDKPFLKFERLLETYLAYSPAGFRSFSASMPSWLREKLFQKSTILKELRELLGNTVDWKSRLVFTEHHLSHAASAFFPSPFESAAVVTVDGVGEWATTAISSARGNTLTIEKEIHYPHSLGLLYSAFTYYLGFRVNSGEYKVMGLAPYGEPRYSDRIRENLLMVSEDGSFRLNMSYFSYCTNLRMVNRRFADLFGGPARRPESELTQREFDIAASIQEVTTEVMLKLAETAVEITGQRDLCLAGGVALNCVANGAIQRSGIVDRLWIQPAAGDAGGAIGAALATWHMMLKSPRSTSSAEDSMSGAYLGPSYSSDEAAERLTSVGATFYQVSEERLLETTSQALVDGQIVGWLQGRMEFGPRALGARSILADPRSPRIQRLLNQKIKYRESFRPFAPSVLKEHASEWFELEGDSPYMSLVADVSEAKRITTKQDSGESFGIDLLNVPRSVIPAVTHVDHSARVQTVTRETNPRYHKLLSAFYDLTGCPVLVNTSFNVRGEPLVCTPEDAFHCFMGTELDLLVIENLVLHKSSQDSRLQLSTLGRYALD